jgi:FMN phosphatase YigB (HAD superfamily)
MSTKRPAKRPKKARVVFLFDVDNTLLDNDHVIEDLKRYLLAEVGVKKCASYWTIFERLRSQQGYADYLGALQQHRSEYPHEMRLLAASKYLIDYPFANRLFPNSLDVLQHVKRWGTVVLLTDGDVVFQPRKVERSGLIEAVQGHVLIYVHKEKELSDVQRHYPAQHYVVVDDKLHLLTAIKKIWRARVTTVFPRQGHYARDPKILSRCPPADITINRIGELLDYDLKTLLEAGRNPGARSVKPGK